MTRRKKRSTRNERRWNEIARIVGPGIHKLPQFFRHGLSHLRNRIGLSDTELVLAFNRCKAWLARAKRDCAGTCECGCKTQVAIGATNAKKTSVWCCDHDPITKTFRGVIHERCNHEIGDGTRKWAHLGYLQAHEARIAEHDDNSYARNEFLMPGALE